MNVNDDSYSVQVSVVVISYNSEDTILETLESIHAQTYHNIELIISDDNSTDDTVQKVKDWLKIKSDRFVRTQIINSKKKYRYTS